MGSGLSPCMVYRTHTLGTPLRSPLWIVLTDISTLPLPLTLQRSTLPSPWWRRWPHSTCRCVRGLEAELGGMGGESSGEGGPGRGRRDWGEGGGTGERGEDWGEEGGLGRGGRTGEQEQGSERGGWAREGRWREARRHSQSHTSQCLSGAPQSALTLPCLLPAS